jgi:hypothetical protein
MTNKTDDCVAFAFILPQGKVSYSQATGTGIMRPWSTRGIVIDMLVKEEALAELQGKDICLVRSVVVDKGLRDHDVTVGMFYELTGVQEVELDIVFAATPQQHQEQPSLSLHHTMYGEEHDSEDDEPELTGDQITLVSLIPTFWTGSLKLYRFIIFLFIVYFPLFLFDHLICQFVLVRRIIYYFVKERAVPYIFASYF